MEDKLIREKINNLDSLPEGYAPNLDSKWELLRAGKPEKKKSLPYFRFAAAASLLLLLGFGFLRLQSEKITVRNGVAKQEIPTKAKNTTIPEYQQKLVLADTSEKIIASSEKARKNAMPELAKTKKINSTAAISANKSIAIIPEVPEQTPETEAALVAAQSPEKAIKKRNRFVEIDFEAPEEPLQLPQSTQTAQVQFRIKFLPQTSDAGLTNAEAPRTLRLQHTF